MSDIVEVNVTEEIFAVTVTDNTPIVTITDETTNITTVIDQQPAVTVETKDETHVTVVMGGGRGPVWLPGRTYDISEIVNMMDHLLTLDHLSLDVGTILTDAENLWSEYGNKELLTLEDGIQIQATSIQHTDTEIAALAVDISNIDGRVTVAQSSIIQQANLISSNVTKLDLHDEDISLHTTRINQTETDITSTTASLVTVGNNVNMANTSIQQANAAIILEVAARELTDNEVTSVKSSLTLAEAAITATATELDVQNNRLLNAEALIDSQGITLTVMDQALYGANYKISATQEMLKNSWSVEIQEETDGTTYASGFGLVQHPLWIISETYAVGDRVFNEGSIWICTVAHTSTLTNFPSGSATNWDLDSEGKRSVFSIRADQFYIFNDTTKTTLPLFSVNGDVITLDSASVIINGAVIIEGIANNRTDAQAAMNVSDGADKTETALTVSGGVNITSGGLNLWGVSAEISVRNLSGVVEYANLSGTGLSIYSSGDVSLYGGSLDLYNISGSIKYVELAGTGLNIYQGGDIILTTVSGTEDSSRAFLKFPVGSGHQINMASDYDTRSLCFWPETKYDGTFCIGYHPVTWGASTHFFNEVKIGGKNKVLIQGGGDFSYNNAYNRLFFEETNSSITDFEVGSIKMSVGTVVIDYNYASVTGGLRVGYNEARLLSVYADGTAVTLGNDTTTYFKALSNSNGAWPIMKLTDTAIPDSLLQEGEMAYYWQLNSYDIYGTVYYYWAIHMKCKHSGIIYTCMVTDHPLA